MTASIVLLLAVATAYLAAHVAFDWLARRFLIVSAAEYLVLGVLLGPQVSGLLTGSVVDSLAPVVTLALGWIGTSVGAQFRLDRLVATPARTYRIAFAESAMTFAFVGAICFVALRWTIAPTDQAALTAAVTFGAMAVATSSVAIMGAGELPGAQGTLVEQIGRSSQINALFAIGVFGLLLSIQHVPVPASRPLTPTEWVVVSIGIGVVGGTLFHLFLGDTPDMDRLFVSLIGGIVLVSGAASYLRLSPLLSALFFGMILVNTSSRPEVLVSTLARVERPFYFVLLLLGGAMWRPSAEAWLAPVALFVVGRAGAKIGASRLAARANGALGELGPDWGRALLGQGRLALAIGVGYLRQGDQPFANVIFTGAIGSILFTEFLSARLVRGVIAAQSPRATSQFAAVPVGAAMADAHAARATVALMKTPTAPKS